MTPDPRDMGSLSLGRPVSDSFGGGPDLSDPHSLIQLADEIAGGLHQQSLSSRAGNAMGGVPYPEHFYARCATVIRALAEYVKAHAPAPKPKEEPAAPQPLAPEAKDKKK